MKTYFLRLKNSDFTLVNNQLVTDVIDLYDNTNSAMATPSYVNYVTERTAYGTDLLGDNTWTGFNVIDDSSSPSIVTESGYVKDGRFVDTTAKIDISTWEINFINTPFDISPYLTFYYNDVSTLNFPDEWLSTDRAGRNDGLYLPDSPRYCKLVLDLESQSDTSSVDFNLFIRVRIGKPVITPLYDRTRGILQKFPEWMELRNDSVTQATPSLATPNTIAGSFINAIAGEWLEDISRDLSYIQIQKFIEEADITQLAWAYICNGVPDTFASVSGDGVMLSRVATAEDFVELLESDDAFFWDEDSSIVYTRKVYTTLQIDDSIYAQNITHIWNWFDEHGLTVDLERHKGESNDSFKKRILDVYKNKPGVGIESFKLALRRELNLWLYEGATPDSSYVGATPEVLEIRDIFDHTDYVGYDGLPTDKLKYLITYLSDKYPTTWGYFRWNEAYWDIDGENSKGFTYIPGKYDANLSPENSLSSGVGDDLDLYIHKPDYLTGPQSFSISATARGFEKSSITDYSPINLDIEIYGTAEKNAYVKQGVDTWINAKATSSSGRVYRANTLIDIDPETLPYSGSTPNTYSASRRLPIADYEKLIPQLNWFDIELERSIGTYIKSLQIKIADITGDYVFQMPRGSVYNSENPSFVVGNQITLYAGDAYIFGTIKEISQTSNVYNDEIDWFDYLTVTNTTSYGNITRQDWTIPNLLYLVNEEATPSFLLDSLEVGFGKYNLIPNDVIQSNESVIFSTVTTGATPVTLYYGVYGFDSGTISSATPAISIDQEIVLHRTYSTIHGTVYYVDTNVSGAAPNSLIEEAKGIATENGFDEYILVEISTLTDGWQETDGWEIWLGGYYGLSDYPTDNFSLYLNDNVESATPTDYISSIAATPGTILSSDLQGNPEVFVSSQEFTEINDYRWYSDKFKYSVTLNRGDAPANQSSWVIPTPDIFWDPYISTPSTKDIFIELITSDDEGNFGAFTVDSLGNEIFIPKENILVNGTSNWVDKSSLSLNSAYSIGDTGPSGGIIFLTPNTPGNTTGRYFEAAPVSSETIALPSALGGGSVNTVEWAQSAFYGELVDGANLIDLSSGLQNTVDIVAQGNTEFSAAQYCYGTTIGGNSDWYLPSLGEMQFVLDNILSGDLSGKTYWTSTQYSATEAYSVHSVNGQQTGLKDENNYVRPIRSFELVTPQYTEESGYVHVIDYSTDTIEISLDLTGLTNYPTQRVIYSSFEETIPDVASGVVDENGPWVNGIKPRKNSNNYNFKTLEFSRSDFGIPNDENHIVTWIGVSSSNDLVVVWTDNNTVKPAFDVAWKNNSSFAPNSIIESGSGSYTYSSFTVRAKLKVDVNVQWNPKMHSGWFFDAGREYYSYADPIEEIASPGLDGATLNSFYASSVVRQGAPVIAKALSATPVDLRRVSFFDDDINLTLKNRQYLYGNDSDTLYLAYDDVYDATVSDVTSGTVLGTNYSTSTNQINIGTTSSKENIYEIQYKLKNSYYVDNESISPNGNLVSKFVFDSTPSDATPYSITYENSIRDSSTPIDIPLNPNYTSIEEGFIFLSFNEYEASTPIVRVSPGTLVADGEDYALVTIHSVDVNGNPKPNQQYIVETSFGFFEESETNYAVVVTDNDGFAFLTLISEYGADTETANINISKVVADGLITTIDLTDITYLSESLPSGIGPADFSITAAEDPAGIDGVDISGVGEVIAQLQFNIQPKFVESYRLYATVDPSAIPSDGLSSTSVYGKVIDVEGNPVPYAYVSYKKGRSIYELFTNTNATPDVGPSASPSATPIWPNSGRVLANSVGVFQIGPFTSATPGDSGYWFVSAETYSASPSGLIGDWEATGDVVFWQEYPAKQNAVVSSNLSIPVPTNQDGRYYIWTDENGIVRYGLPVPPPATVNAFPTTFDEATPTAGATPVTNIWSPPRWYAINRYEQYQRGILGDDFYVYRISNSPNVHPDYREF